MSVDISPPTEITDTTNVEERTEEYAYLDKCGFTSELFKIEVRGLPKFFGIAVRNMCYYFLIYIT